MNEEGEYIVETQCPFCVFRDHSPSCIWVEKRKCSHFKPVILEKTDIVNKASLEVNNGN